MRTVYDDLIQEKPKELSKSIADITCKYINPDTKQPTIVPASHYEKELGKVTEKMVSQKVNYQFLAIIYDQLKSLMKSNEELFYKALILLDMNLKPKDLDIPKQVAINNAYESFKEMKSNAKTSKTEFHFMNPDVIAEYNRGLTDLDLQGEAISYSNFLEDELDGEVERMSEMNNDAEFSDEENDFEDTNEDIDLEL